MRGSLICGATARAEARAIEVKGRRLRGRALGSAAFGLAVLAAAGAILAAGSSSPTPGLSSDRAAVERAPATRASSPEPRPRPPFAVGIRAVRLVDPSRQVSFPGRGARARPLLTYVRYPALGSPSHGDRVGGRPAVDGGPYPLIVFGHGFALTPKTYARLLRAWTRAGYVVAAPVFPLENANAPGGPDESDLANQPRDFRFVISRLLRMSAARYGPLSGLIDPHRIAAAGHSDGGETALAVTYDRRLRDPRVGAAVILAGARFPGMPPGPLTRAGTPLLAAQGTADVVNRPSATYDFYGAGRRPKYLLKLLGASHIPPYSNQQPQLRIVARVTTAFLDRYLKGKPISARRLTAFGSARGTSVLVARP